MLLLGEVNIKIEIYNRAVPSETFVRYVGSFGEFLLASFIGGFSPKMPFQLKIFYHHLQNP